MAGGVLVISTFLGRNYENFADPDRVRWETFRLAAELVEHFKREYGSPICRDIQTKIMGRYFNLWDDKEYNEFLAAGGHEDKCPSVCANAAKWVAEILAKEGLLKED